MMSGEVVSLRKYAEHRGCRLSAVQKAIKRQRLVASVVRDEAGAVRGLDVAAADREWQQNTQALKVSNGALRAARRSESAAAAPEPTRLDGEVAFTVQRRADGLLVLAELTMTLPYQRDRRPYPVNERTIVATSIVNTLETDSVENTIAEFQKEHPQHDCDYETLVFYALTPAAARQLADVLIKAAGPSTAGEEMNRDDTNR